MDAGNMYRSHFGSRYHTRADAVTQAFLRVLFDSLPVANCRLRSLLLETRPHTVNAYAWFACAPNMLQQWRLRKKACNKISTNRPFAESNLQASAGLLRGGAWTEDQCDHSLRPRAQTEGKQDRNHIWTLGRSPLKNCTDDLDDQTWRELE